MTDTTKFRIYVRPGGKMRVKKKSSTPNPNPSSVAFVLRHITGRTYEEQVSEANRLMGVVQMTEDDKKVIMHVLKSRCLKSQ